MKKVLKILVGILVVIALAMGGLFYALQPEGGVQQDITGNREITKEDIIKMGILQSLKFNRETESFEGSMTLTAQDISNIVYTFMKNYEDDMIANEIKISDDKLNVTVPVEVEFLKTKATVTAVPSVENGALVVTIDNVKVGKINISGGILAKILASQQSEIPFEIRDRSIIIPPETLKPLNLTGIKIENNELKTDMRITLRDAMRYAYDILVQYGNSLKPAA
ncbi:hypothetical protein [Peptacetobacter sp. AB845]|uniref:hypothetical protein n=1 Tax=Peptacetobacter sp. AB845 TaxID=3388429 RepID=UPI0039C900A1